MPNLWKYITKADSAAPKIEEYQFTAADFIDPEDEKEEPVEKIPEEPADLTPPEPEVPKREIDPLGYAKFQSEEIIKEAKAQADLILSQSRAQAAQETAQLRQQATEEGFRAGYQAGIQQGTAKALEENLKTRAELGKQVDAEQAEFLQKANQALNRQMEENLLEMRDLSIAIAEKVICISLKSSADVITKMIQMAVDKQKRREWVHIYVAECDARRLTELPPALSSALAELSDHVRIIPMADDESGTCLVEFPDEIIDASARTQVQNIKELLNSHSAPAGRMSSLLQETEGNRQIPTSGISPFNRK